MKKITVETPEKFLEICKRYYLNPADVLEAFVHNLGATDASYGSDERDTAFQYFRRTHAGRGEKDNVDLFY